MGGGELSRVEALPPGVDLGRRWIELEQARGHGFGHQIDDVQRAGDAAEHIEPLSRFIERDPDRTVTHFDAIDQRSIRVEHSDLGRPERRDVNAILARDDRRQGKR